MARTFWIVVGALFALLVLRSYGIFGYGPLGRLIDYVLGLACYFAVPAFFLALLYAPGLFRELTSSWHHFWDRMVARRRVVDELKHKIARLDKSHHMAQLGSEYLRQDRYERARQWFEKALEKDPNLLDARYKLALCHVHDHDPQAAVELLEQVHEQKPEHDYGMAYLRLAQCHQQLGNFERADEIYRTLMKFYPGHPEGSYSYAMLKVEGDEMDEARRLLRDLISSVTHSPAFQRRRNRHWVLKARWWLFRHGKD